jgi:hypothetical protein
LDVSAVLAIEIGIVREAAIDRVSEIGSDRAPHLAAVAICVLGPAAAICAFEATAVAETVAAAAGLPVGRPGERHDAHLGDHPDDRLGVRPSLEGPSDHLAYRLGVRPSDRQVHHTPADRNLDDRYLDDRYLDDRFRVDHRVQIELGAAVSMVTHLVCRTAGPDCRTAGPDKEAAKKYGQPLA